MKPKLIIASIINLGIYVKKKSIQIYITTLDESIHYEYYILLLYINKIKKFKRFYINYTEKVKINNY